MRAEFSGGSIDILSLTDSIGCVDQSMTAVGVASTSPSLLVTGQHRAMLERMLTI